MFSRAAMLLFCAVVLTGCGDVGALDGAATNGEQQDASGFLSVVGSTSIVVAPRGTANIRVAYREASGRAVSGIAVEFVLEGEAPAVSLTVDQSSQGTDENGEIGALLTVGTDAARFKVRANAAGAEPVYVQVEVLPSAVREVAVEAHYSGLRAVTARAVTALPDASCAVAESSGVKGEALEIYGPSEVDRVFKLGPGLRYAFVGWGRDDTGSLLALGCTDLIVPVDRESGLEPVLEPVIVELLDRNLTLRGSYGVALALDVSASIERATAQARLGGETLLSGKPGDEADFYLDAIEGMLLREGPKGAAEQVAAARLDGSLATSLSALLDEADVGPRSLLSIYTSQLSERGSVLTLRADYGVSSLAGVPMTFSVTGMVATGANEQAKPVSLSQGRLPAVTIDAAYDDARAAISVETLIVQLPLGEYAKRLLFAIEREGPAGQNAATDEAAGCLELSVWAKSKPAIAASCDQSCVLKACGMAREDLLSAARARLSSLDADHQRIGLRGQLFVYDGKDDDGLVDALRGGEFLGSWGKSADADRADVVRANWGGADLP